MILKTSGYRRFSVRETYCSISLQLASNPGFIVWLGNCSRGRWYENSDADGDCFCSSPAENPSTPLSLDSLRLLRFRAPFAAKAISVAPISKVVEASHVACRVFPAKQNIGRRSTKLRCPPELSEWKDGASKAPLHSRVW